MAQKKEKPKGRPSAYKTQYATIAGKMCEMGATDQDLAEAFSVTVTTISNWKLKHKAFFDALKTNKAGYDDQVERALALRAIGYSHPETKLFYDPKTGEVVREEVIKHYPPDVKACSVWLFNRRADQWHPLGKQEGGDAAEDIAKFLANLAKELPK